LGGGEFNGCEVPALKRDDFMASGDLGALFTRIRTLMPFDEPGTLSEAIYVDVLSFLLQENGYPAGSADLAPGLDQLAAIRLAKATPAVSGSLVKVVGCLVQEGGQWMLSNSTEPVVTDQSTASPADLQEAQSAPAGRNTFRLFNLSSSPDMHKGHRMEAHGLLVRLPNGDRINVSSLDMVSAACGP
jgi:hypothetical protein